MAELPGRNDLCHCGSGKKYKRCHMQEDQKAHSAQLAARQGAAPAVERNNTPVIAAAALIVVAAVVLFALGLVNWALGIGIGGLMLLGGYVLLRDPPPPRGGDGANPSSINFGL